jgi:hypothetical protein
MVMMVAPSGRNAAAKMPQANGGWQFVDSFKPVLLHCAPVGAAFLTPAVWLPNRADSLVNNFPYINRAAADAQQRQ